MRDGPFKTEDEIADYLAGDLVECLECGRWFQILTGRHMATHGMSQADYRQRWGLPALVGLAGRAYRQDRQDSMRHLIDSGVLTYDHLPRACEAARDAERPPKVPASTAAQSARIAALRPGDHHRLPPGSKRANGRDADRAREYQRQRRANLKANPKQKG